MLREEAKRIAQGLITDFKCESETMVDFCNTVIEALEQQPCDDYISRQAAIDAVETIGFDFSDSDLSEVELEEVCEAIGEVRQTWLQRIKRLPSVEPEKCSDCISRNAVLDIAKSSKSNWIDNSVLFKRVSELPSVEPERTVGKWINVNGSTNSADCSCCGNRGRAWMNYCYICGAKMGVDG